MEKLFLIVIYLVEVHLLIAYHDFGLCFCFGAGVIQFGEIKCARGLHCKKYYVLTNFKNKC